MAEIKKETTDNRLKREILGVVFTAVAVFLILALASYESSDPSFTNFRTGHEVQNYVGVVGSYLSDSLLQVFGFSSYLFPFFLIFFAVELFLDRSTGPGIKGLLGFAGLVLSTSALLSASYEAIPLFGGALDPGGILGFYFWKLLSFLLSQVGASIAVVVILIISLMVTLDISVVTAAKKLLAAARIAVAAIKFLAAVIAQKLKRAPIPVEESPPEPRQPVRESPVIREELVIREKEPAKPRAQPKQIAFDFLKSQNAFVLPSLDLLDVVEKKGRVVKKESLIMNARLLEKKLADFGVEATVVEVKPGPVINMYEVEPAAGVKINKIANLSDDLAMALKAQSVRIIAPIPGKSVVGIEIPNQGREMVSLREVLDNDDFMKAPLKLPIALGQDIVGNPIVADLAKMPHLLIAGTTGSGKSVSLNAMICSILFKAGPDEVKFIMIDPKRLELSAYEGVPHLLHPVVVNAKKAAHVLKWAVEEMERRYQVIGEGGGKSIEAYNKLVRKGEIAKMRKAQAAAIGAEIPPPPEILPYIIIVIDELADLMMVAQHNVEESLARLAQMARAAGIHLIIATQRPSVDVITGIIKANFPTRISFQVSSKVDSRTILDQLGAEKLLGSGDMLFIPPGTSKITRIHGAFVSDGEIRRVVDFIQKQRSPSYDESLTQYNPETREDRALDEDFDEKYDEAVELVTDLGQASISLVQRYMKIGYNRAARIIERMEAEGIVGPSDGARPRKVLVGKLPE
ncbi:MAG: DNA translocase FtsK 4TM domain-containing protein [Deltaproteobacteria bacterium]|nr:DNA translocase FtsK 4TM domain-containing protein [Deltaproteobacteria bacterium]